MIKDIQKKLYGAIDNIDKRLDKLEKPSKAEKLVQKAEKLLDEGKVDAQGYVDVVNGKAKKSKKKD